MKAMSTHNMERPKVMGFLSLMFKALGGSSGPGNTSALAESLQMLPADAFRFLTGCDQEWLTYDRRTFAEASFAIATECSLPVARGRWTLDCVWMPRNPNADSYSYLSASKFDLDFIRDFELAEKHWDKAFGMSGFISRTAKGTDSETDRIRAVIGLARLGFSEPMQFFTSREPQPPV